MSAPPYGRRFGLSLRRMLRFSSRVPKALAPNRLARARRRLRREGVDVADLTESNPTLVGLRYPPRLLEPLADPRGVRYEPAPLGLESARRAVADELGHLGFDVDPGRIVLTASTSDAYATLFKLLCDPGHGVLVPCPSYPLFEHLTRLEGVKAVPYALDFHGRWEVDVAGLRADQTEGIRAVLAVSPNNPTGSFVTASEFEHIAAVCRARGLALIVDEVFGRYPMSGDQRGPSVLARPPDDVLTCVLGGLSKAAGLPQLKLGWLVVAGPDSLVEEALARLELICDTYLQVATPVQHAAATLLQAGGSIATQIAQRVRANYGYLSRLSARYPTVTLLPTEGGWYAVLQVPGGRSEEELVLEILEHDHVLVQPGYFFDFPRESFLVVSLLPEPTVFEAAIGWVLTAAS